MNKIYKIKLRNEKKPTLTVNPNTAVLLGIDKTKVITLRFGSMRQFANITVNSDVPETEIGLSSKLLANLHLPDFPDYELRVNKSEIEIGPFIGMLMSSEDKRLTFSFLERMKIHLSDYGKLHGAVIIFALDMVDAVGQLVEGYCYNPFSQRFEKGVYPFPSAIYRTIGLNEHWKNCFLSAIGNRLFNSHYFNKWEMYQWYSNNPELSSHVPFTCKFQTANNVFELLEKYGKVFIKPISGLGGRGIIQVSYTDGKYIFKYRENGENRSDVIENKDEASEYIDIKLSHGKFLIQQPIELFQMKGRVVDFRCVMQKNQSGSWECKAIIGRYGGRGSVVSNISSGGTAFKLDNLTKYSIPLPESKAAHLGDDISVFALKVCNAINVYGINCGTLGLDIGVDVKGDLWLIEINNRDPDPTIALDVNDRLLYENIKTGILQYAKYLSGF